MSVIMSEASRRACLMNIEAALYFSNTATDLVSTEKPKSQFVSQFENKHSKESLPVTKASDADEELMSQFQSGDKAALTLLFRRHARYVLNVGNRILRDCAEAEDLLQEVFVFVAQRAHLFDPAKSSALSWIIQVAYHRAFDRRRYLNQRNHYDVQEFQDDLHGLRHSESTVDTIGCRDLLRKFQDELTPEQRQTLELHFFQGYTFHEIAGKTGQTLGNVRHHYYRGLERLRARVLPGKRD